MILISILAFQSPKKINSPFSLARRICTIALESTEKFLGLVSTDNSSLTKIICRRDCGKEFAFTHNKDNLYFLAGSPLSKTFDSETSP